MPERFFSSDSLQVGDCWPRHGSLRRSGAIVAIEPYTGDREFAAEYGITGVARFADGTGISIGGDFPGDAELVAGLAAYRTPATEDVA